MAKRKVSSSPSPSAGIVTWYERNAEVEEKEKRLMAAFFARHDFLVSLGSSAETQARNLISTIFVNPGSTPNILVEEILTWVKEHLSKIPPDLTWYTTGHLIPVTLRKFRDDNMKEDRSLDSSAQLFLYPGKVSHIYQAVTGENAVTFAENLDTKFDYSLLSAYGFDWDTGDVKFHSEDDSRLQRACALHYAEIKCLFLNPRKFRKTGNTGYQIGEILRRGEMATIYTVSSGLDDEIKYKFKQICSNIFAPAEQGNSLKKLRLRIIGVPGIDAPGTATYTDEAIGSIR